MNIPDPIFKKDLNKISWKKIYEREYGVQYSEVAVSLLAFAKYHFPITSLAQIVIPGEGSNSAFYIDDRSWIKLVEGLNKKYTANVKQLEKYEKQFLRDGRNYLNLAKKISISNLEKLSDKQLLSLFLDHQDKRNRYSCFAWSAFILNNYVYEKFKWLPCLDIHNKPWTKEEFKEHIKSFTKVVNKKEISFKKMIKKLKIKKKDLQYLDMAKRFVYIKDARDDFRRESVFYSNKKILKVI